MLDSTQETPEMYLGDLLVRVEVDTCKVHRKQRSVFYEAYKICLILKEELYKQQMQRFYSES